MDQKDFEKLYNYARQIQYSRHIEVFEDIPSDTGLVSLRKSDCSLISITNIKGRIFCYKNDIYKKIQV